MPAPVPTSDEIRRIAAEVLQRPDYQLDSGDGMARGADSLLIRALNWLWDAVGELAQSLAFLPGFLRYPAAILLCIALALLIYRILRSLAGTARIRGGAEETRRDRTARGSKPEEFETLALTSLQDGRIVEAERWLLRAAMLRIEAAEKRTPRPGTTNRELLRRYRATPLQAPLQTLVDTIDVHWYGDRPADIADYDRCHQSYQQLRQIVADRAASAAATDPKPTTAR